MLRSAVFSCACLAALLLSACQPQLPAQSAGEAPGLAPVATVQPNAAAPVPASATRNAPDVTLEVVPGEVHACPGRDHVAAKIHWAVTRPGVQSVKVFVSGPGSERKLFAEGGATGDAETGPWMTARAMVELVDGSSGAPLGAYTMPALPCE